MSTGHSSFLRQESVSPLGKTLILLLTYTESTTYEYIDRGLQKDPANDGTSRACLSYTNSLRIQFLFVGANFRSPAYFTQ